MCRHIVKIQPTSVWGKNKTWHCCPNAEPISQCFYLPTSEETLKKRVPRDINFFFYFKIFSQQDETQRSPEGPKPIEPSRTEAPLIIAMSLCCRTRRSGEREKERKKGKERGRKQSQAQRLTNTFTPVYTYKRSYVKHSGGD